jgi:glutathione synthase/RimK-type ligase-like ATP-grasp enzyme
MIKKLLERLARAKKFRQRFPEPAKRFLRHFLPLEAYAEQIWLAEDQYADVEEISSYPGKVDVMLGIIKEFTHEHKHYIGACRELGVPYKLLDISGPNWIDVIGNSDCDAFLIRPSSALTVWKQMFDERLKVMCEEMGKIIYPSYNEVWFYESKRRMHYWLKVNNIPHPKTWVFYDRKEALQFAKEMELPIVYKSDLGSSASGVKIFRDRPHLLRFVNKCFRKGFVTKDTDIRDKQWGSMLFQEYLPDIAEWRIIRLGKSYFGHQKLKKGWSHSGSGRVGWYDPPKQLLDFAREVTDKGKFTSMDLDIFETKDGHYLVNELQSIFGSYLPYQMLVNEKPGRYIYEPSIGQWIFEEGIFCQNGSCNLRVKVLLEKLGKSL